MVEFVNSWILLKQRDLTIQRLFEYWFQGVKPPGTKQPRWSVLRDVLGWGAGQKPAKPDV